MNIINQKIGGFSLMRTKIEGVYIIQPAKHSDDRGYFMETYNAGALKSLTGVDYNFIQDNQSKSSYGTVRGLHFQREPYAQAKLVRVVSGCVYDVAVDLRPGSPTFGEHVSVELDDERNQMLLIPRGCAHGFSVLSKTAIFSYKVDNIYNKESEGGLIYSDPNLDIDWGVPANKIQLSGKDKQLPTLVKYLESENNKLTAELENAKNAILMRQIQDMKECTL
ncbi:MAG: dTDP-4-dehydrorhamnose 3,5-epimerase [Alphaproteobacteria bacterium]|nr:dTDP-4-dehydrorhamnose 3,5-epimerase [Alphaproteobacteria bacterium]